MEIDYEATQKNLEKDRMCFLFMCPNEDKIILLKEPQDKTMEDFVRLISLATVFELRGAYLKLYTELEEIDKIDKIFEYLYSLDFKTVEKWVEDFIGRIEEPEIQKIAKSAWVDKLRIIQGKIKDGKFEFKYLT